MYHLIINGEKSKDRRDWVESEFKRVGLGEPHFFKAIMGNKVPKEELEKLVAPECTLTPGEIGCSLSHLKIYEEFLKTDAPSILIFEDDLEFTPNFDKEVLFQAIEFINHQEGPATLLLRPARFMRSFVEKLSDKISIHNVNEICQTHAYIINREAAENILKFQRPMALIIDGWRYYTLLRLTKVYCLNDYFIKQSSKFNSVIASMRGKEVRQKISSQQEIFNNIVKTLPREEQKRISRERIKRTALRVWDILKGRKNMNG